MPSEQDKIGDRINMPLMAVAGLVTVIGFILTITIALIWIGLPLMFIGVAWMVALFFSAKMRAKSSNLM